MRGSERYNDIKEWIRAEENTHTVKALIIILIGIGLAGIVFTFGGIMDAIRYQKSNPREKKVKERRRKKSPPKKAVPQPSIPEQKAENESFGYASIEELILNNAEVNDKIDSLASYMGSIDARLERLEAEVLKNMRMKYVEEATREKQIL